MGVERIMVIGDDEALRRLISLNLRARGAEVEERPFDQSLLIAATAVAGIIVLDLGPDGAETRGWEMVRALRATGWARSLPFVVLGATWPTPSQIERLQPLVFVRKPFSIGTLLQAIRVANVPQRTKLTGDRQLPPQDSGESPPAGLPGGESELPPRLS